MQKSIKRAYARSVSVCALVCGAMILLSSAASAEDTQHKFDISAESTAHALNDFSKQAGVEILFPYDVASQTTAPAVKGSLSTKQALAQILVGSGLEIASENGKTITLRIAAEAAGISAIEQPTEVIVTGTHIRGANPTSPVHTVSRKDIELSGYSQISDVMRNQPENFGGGQNADVIQAQATNDGNRNISNGASVNLRGLGTDATLVLLNGHRLSGDTYFPGADISSIPLAAVQRIEIVPDGASALYGSDAVAGVVNMILRKDFAGTEISARVGDSARGGGGEQTYGALTGFTGHDSHLLASFEYSKRDGIIAAQRDRTRDVTPQTTLINPNERRSLFLNAGLDITDHVSLSFDGLLGDRAWTSASQVRSSTKAYTYAGYTPSFSLAAGLDVDLPGDWKIHTAAIASGSRNSASTRTAISYSVSHYKNDTQSLELTADGTLFATAAGPVKAAFGGGYRTERFRQSLPGQASYRLFSRNISYAYAEVLAPLVVPSPERTGLHELELSASARAENYSDFGSTSNPKIGLRYVPFQPLTLRTTWGKSFKAPAFLQLYEDSYLFLWDAGAVGGTGNGTVLMTFGGNPNLKPETSTSWTFGGDYKPMAGKPLTISATYFNIDYTNRVVQPVANYPAGLSNPLYAPFVQSAPSPAEQQTLINSAYEFDNYSSGAYDPAQVIAVLQDKYANASAQAISGIDLGYRQTFGFEHGALDTFANASWLSLKQKTISTVPAVELAGTIFNAPKFKARGGFSWRSGGWSATGIVNLVGEEIDNAASPEGDVASWTTVDATVSYRFPADAGLSKGVKVSLSASNLFDRSPPYTVSPTYYPGLHFDSTNSSIVGRFVSLTVTKAW